MDLKLSQKKLAEMAGIQRRQLATLESGGNVTLNTLRKVLVHLPNLESFEIEGVDVQVMSPQQQFDDQKFNQAMSLMVSALAGISSALTTGAPPSPKELHALRQVNKLIYESIGDTDTVERIKARMRADGFPDDEEPPPPPDEPPDQLP